MLVISAILLLSSVCVIINFASFKNACAELPVNFYHNLVVNKNSVSAMWVMFLTFIFENLFPLFTMLSYRESGFGNRKVEEGGGLAKRRVYVSQWLLKTVIVNKPKSTTDVDDNDLLMAISGFKTIGDTYTRWSKWQCVRNKPGIKDEVHA